jgi:hypothetical protein
MASIITATTTSGLTQSADNSGVLQLASGTGNLVTVPSVTGTAMVSGNMPAFRAYLASNQTVSNVTNTKITLDTEVFDTANCFNTSTNRFTPNVAGYYQFNVTLGATASTTLIYNYIQIYKNGTADSIAIYGPYTNAGSYGVLSTLIYMNGTTDYIELYVQISGVGTLLVSGGATSISTYMSGFLARAA